MYVWQIPAALFAVAAVGLLALSIVLSARAGTAPHHGRLIGVVAFGLLLGMFARGNYIAENIGAQLAEGPVSVGGRVTARPVLSPDGTGRLEMETREVALPHHVVQASRNVVVFADNRLVGIEPGRLVQVEGELRCGEPLRRVGAVCATYRLYADTETLTIAGSGTSERVLNRLYGGLDHALREIGDPVEGTGVDRERAALMRALMLGDRGYLSGRSSDAFRRAGVVHTLALSGMHLSVIAGAAAILLSRIAGRRRGLMLSVFVALVFVAIVGVRPSLLRALIMYAVFVAAFIRGSPLSPLNALAVTFLISVLGWPTYAYTLSFQLSFLSLFGMFGFAPALGERLVRWVPVPLAYALAASVAAVTATAPLLLFVFGEFHPIGVLASVVVGPLITLFLGYTVLHTALQAVLSAAGVDAVNPIASDIGSALYRVIDVVVSSAAEIPGLSGPGGWIAAGVLVTLLLVTLSVPLMRTAPVSGGAS